MTITRIITALAMAITATLAACQTADALQPQRGGFGGGFRGARMAAPQMMPMTPPQRMMAPQQVQRPAQVYRQPQPVRQIETRGGQGRQVRRFGAGAGLGFAGGMAGLNDPIFRATPPSGGYGRTGYGYGRDLDDPVFQPTPQRRYDDAYAEPEAYVPADRDAGRRDVEQDARDDAQDARRADAAKPAIKCDREFVHRYGAICPDEVK